MRPLFLILALAAPAFSGSPALPVTPELLGRWGITVEGYKNLSPEQKSALQSDLTAGEEVRLSRLQRIKQIRPNDWAGFVDAREFVTPEGIKLIEAYEAGLKAKGLPIPVNLVVERADGLPMTHDDLQKSKIIMDKLFDGAATLEPKRAPAGTKIVMDARISNETVHSVTMTLPERGLVLEVGQLGTSGRSALLRPSPYANITKHVANENKLVDYRVRAQIGYVDLNARYFSTGPDPRVQRMLDLGGHLGMDPTELQRWRANLTYDDSYKAQGLVMASLMTQMGRAYNLFGPVDIAWAATTLTKLYHLAPNQAFDESLGLRVKLPGEDLFFGLFGGVTQNLSPASSTIYQEMVNGGHAKEDLYWESAPHWTASLWGKAPGMNDMRFSLSGGQRYNDHTTVTQGELAILSNFHRVPVAARLQHKSEKGEGIAFDRETTRLQIDAELSDRVTGFLAYEKDAIQYGNAGVRSDGVWLGARWDFGAGKGRLTVDHVFNQGYGKDSPLRPYMPDAAAAITRLLATGVEAAQEADDLLQGMAQGATQAEIDALINRLSHALSSLDGPGAAALVSSIDGLTDLQRLWLTDFLTRTFPAGSLREEEIRRVLEAAFGADLPEVERMQLLGDLKGNLSDALELSRKLADPEVWEAAAIAAGRTALVQALAKDLEVDIPLIDKTITMKTHAPVLIAAMGALNTRLSPLHPMTSEDASAWLISEAGHYMGLGGNATTDEIAAALLSQGVETLVAGVTRQIDEAIELQLSQGAYDPAVAAQLILGQLSPLSAAAMRELYGPNLEGLLPPPGTAADAVKAYMHERLTGDVAAALRTRMGPAAEQAVAEMAAWAGEVISREINLTTIHLMLASEELERMMVDKGKKASDLGVDMLQNSFTRLDARDRRKLAASLTGARQTLQSRQAKEDQRLGEKLTELGRARLEAMQLDPSWPKGLEIVIEDQHWAPLLASYGDTSFLEMLQALADKRRASKKTEPLVITFSYDAKRTMGGFVATRREGGDLDFALGPVKTPREAQMRLGWLPDYLK